MSWVSILAVYFILWWLVLFATLPFGLRTQDEAQDVTLGTTASAPKGAHVARAFLRTTIVSLVIFALIYGVTVYSGFGFDDIPRVVPDFD